MIYIKYFLEGLPVLLAIYVILTCSSKIVVERRKRFRKILLLSMVSAAFLIVAQTSWFVSYVIQGNLLGTVFANNIWSMFNSLSMLIIILISKGRPNYVEKPPTTRF